MHDEALTRWQRGWSAARGWNDAQRVDDVTVVRVGEPKRRVEYVRTEWLMTISLPDQALHPVPASLGWTTLTPLLVARTPSL